MILVIAVIVGPPAAGSEPRVDAVSAPQIVQPSPGHPKLDSALARVAEAARTSRASALILSAALDVPATTERVQVSIHADSPDTVAELVAYLEGRLEHRYADLLQAWIRPADLLELASQAAVRFIEVPQRSELHAVVSEGVSASNAAAWKAAGLDGAGVKIAVIDSGFANYAQRQAAGELPPDLIVSNFCSSGFATEPHGTAVAEIVHDIAPRATLYLVCADSGVALGTAKDYVKAQGVAIVTMSAAFPGSSRGDGRGGASTPEGIVADAAASGILWVNSAGNYARGHWSGTFIDHDLNGWHNFTPLGDTNTFTLPTGIETMREPEVGFLAGRVRRL